MALFLGECDLLSESCGLLSLGKCGLLSEEKRGLLFPGKCGLLSVGKLGLLSKGKRGLLSVGRLGLLSKGKRGLLSLGKPGKLSEDKLGLLRFSHRGTVAGTPLAQMYITSPGLTSDALAGQESVSRTASSLYRMPATRCVCWQSRHTDTIQSCRVRPRTCKSLGESERERKRESSGIFFS